MKNNMGFIGILIVLSFNLSLFSMEKEKEKIARPERTAEIQEGLGQFAQLPDELIINIALKLIDASPIPQEVLNNLTNLALTNKYINNLLNYARRQLILKNKIDLIRDLLNIEKAKKEKEKAGYQAKAEDIAINLGAIHWLENILPTYKDKESLIQIINNQMQTVLQNNQPNEDKVKLLLKMAQMIIDSGFDVNKTDSSLLEDALINSNYPLSRLLLDNGINIDKSVQSYLNFSMNAKKFVEDYQKDKNLIK